MVNNGAGGAYGNSLAEESLFVREKAKILFLYKYLGVVILFFIKMSIMCEQILD